MQKLRTSLVGGVVVVSVLGAGGGFYLVHQTSPEAARSLLAIDAGMLVALAVCVWVLLGPTLARIDELVEALRALARGEKHTRIDAAEFAGLGDVARAVNEVAAALCENDDPNLGPVQKKVRDPSDILKLSGPVASTARVSGRVPKAPRAPEPSHAEGGDDVDGRVSAHPEIGAVRVRKKPDPEPAPEPAPAPSAAPPSAPAKAAEPPAPERSPGRPSDDDTVIEPAAPEPRLPGRGELQTLFADFVREKRAANHEDVDVDFDAFADTILAECERLVQEHNCRGVRFEIALADGEVSLRPRLLR